MVEQPSISAIEALQRLCVGNARFTSNSRSEAKPTADRRPFAIVITCSDSPVPVEKIFDRSSDDLLVLSVAGNVVGPPLIERVELATSTFGTPLVVVMGHSDCGAVKATLDLVRAKLDDPTNRIRPAVVSLVELDAQADDAALLDAAIRANVRCSADHLRHGSRQLEALTQQGKLAVVGAQHNRLTGRVEFFDVPAELTGGC